MPRFLSNKLLCPVRAKRERRKEARPGELIQAALELFVEKGFAATRSEEVAARAGVSKGTLFLYFQSKEDLLKAVITESLAGRFTEWNEEFEAFEGSTADMLRYCTQVWWERVGATPVSGLTKLMLSEGNNFPELAAFYQREVVAPGHALMRRILRRGIDRGEFLPVDVEHAIYTVVAPMIFLFLVKHNSTWVESDIELDPLKYIATQTEIAIRGLSRHPASISPAA
ncbi:TetR/AcrR family transcriptional regulator [Variovorax sp. LT1R16]|uniref:TetR/AcrR family transcriptional regulator n=1 Tax=Variovorax sp. LT1R16 TaxID=3443728 RepID=UPI003F480614